MAEHHPPTARISSLKYTQCHDSGTSTSRGAFNESAMTGSFNDAYVSVLKACDAIKRKNDLYGIDKAFFRDNSFETPLSKNELIVLGCAILVSDAGRALRYIDVMTYAREFPEHTMSTPSIYHAIEGLIRRNLLRRVADRPTENGNGRPSQAYQAAPNARKVFFVAILYDKQLKLAQEHGIAA